MRKAAWGIFLTCLLVYLSNGRAHPEVDCVAAPYAAWSLVRYGTLDLRYYPELGPYVGASVGCHIRALPNGAWISQRPPGDALLATPFVLPVAMVRAQPLRPADMHHLGKLAAAVGIATAAALFFVVCRRLTPAAAWPATVLFALGTCLWSVASQALWMHAPATLWLCCGLYFLSHPSRERAVCSLAAGLVLGMAVMARPTTCFFALATLGALLAQRHWGRALWLSLGGAIPATGLLAINWMTFGHPFLGGYARECADSLSPPWWVGLAGLLIAPSRGVLVYSPALLLVLPGVWLLRRSDAPWSSLRGILVAWLIAAGITVLFYSRWHAWWGGWCYGPRFLCETMPALCLLFGIAYSALRQRWLQAGAIGLVGLSVAVHLVGVFGYQGYASWQRRHDLHDQGRCLFAFEDTQIEAHARALAGKLTGRGRSDP